MTLAAHEIRLDEEDRAAWSAWRDAALTPAVRDAVRSLYADLDAAVAERGPTCWVSGECCKFDAYGHRLYVTGLEIAVFLCQEKDRRLADAAEPHVPGGTGIPPVSSSLTWEPAHKRAAPPLPLNILSEVKVQGACRYQITGRCSVHTIRPMGCRVFFCERGTEAWQHDLYEAFLQRLQTLHTQLALPYRYMEWRAGLAEAEHLYHRGYATSEP